MITAVEETITPQKADWYLKFNKRNRPVSRAHVLWLAKEMKEGKWVLNGEPIKFDNEGNLMDGQHRLLAVIESDTSVPFLVVRGIPKSFFWTLDTGKNRSNSDVFNLNGISNAACVSSVTLRYMLLRDGLVALGRNGNPSKKHKFTKSDILDCYWVHPDVFQEAARVGARIVGREIPVLTKVEVGGLYAYLTLEKGHDTATVLQFLKELCSGITDTLAIRQVYLKIGRLKQRNLKLSGSETNNLIAKAWNRFLKGKKNNGINNSSTEAFL